ncbi:MAG: hypothetical protein M0Z67_00875 [Nitrospiraceae bacterium]|nr:hypothetical protein [Nitrospiraceae bacterium]
MSNVRGKSLKATIRDVAEGYVIVNPLFLKSFDRETLRDFYSEISKVQVEIRAERFPTHDILAIRSRNLRLQRLFAATMVIRNYAKERRVPLA